MSGTRFWLDGEAVVALPLPDRGADFGDGLFETLRLHRGCPLFLQRHLRRLADGLERLAIVVDPALAEEQLQRVVEQLSDQGHREAALRITVVRGATRRGYRPDPAAVARILIAATPLAETAWPPAHTPATLCQSEIRWSTQPLLAGLKHLNRLEQVLAADTARRLGTDEALMLDQLGYLVSVSAGNLYLVRDGAILTPELQRCGIAGTLRAELLENLAPGIGVEVRVSALTLADLATADAVFFSNSLLGFRPVARFGELDWQDHGVCERLQATLAEQVQ